MALGQQRPFLPTAPQAAAGTVPGAPLTSQFGGGRIGAPGGPPGGMPVGGRDGLTAAILAQRAAGGFGGPPGLGGPGAAQGQAPVPGGPMGTGIPGPAGVMPALPGGPRPPGVMAGMQPGMQPGVGGGAPPVGMPPMPGRGPYG